MHWMNEVREDILEMVREHAKHNQKTHGGKGSAGGGSGGSTASTASTASPAGMRKDVQNMLGLKTSSRKHLGDKFNGMAVTYSNSGASSSRMRVGDLKTGSKAKVKKLLKDIQSYGKKNKVQVLKRFGTAKPKKGTTYINYATQLGGKSLSVSFEKA